MSVAPSKRSSRYGARDGSTSPVTEALRLDHAALALRRIADRQVRGKIVLLTERYTGRLVPSPDTVRS